MFAISAVIRNNLRLALALYGQLCQRGQLLQCSSAADDQAVTCTGSGSWPACAPDTVQVGPIQAAGQLVTGRLAWLGVGVGAVCAVCVLLFAVVREYGGHVGHVVCVVCYGSPRPTKFSIFPYF